MKALCVIAYTLIFNCNISGMLKCAKSSSSIYCYKVYSEHLLEPLLQTLFALSGPRTTILVSSFADIWEATSFLFWKLFSPLSYFLLEFNAVGLWDPIHNCPWTNARLVEEQFWSENCPKNKGACPHESHILLHQLKGIPYAEWRCLLYFHADGW